MSHVPKVFHFWLYNLQKLTFSGLILFQKCGLLHLQVPGQYTSVRSDGHLMPRYTNQHSDARLDAVLPYLIMIVLHPVAAA